MMDVSSSDRESITSQSPMAIAEMRKPAARHISENNNNELDIDVEEAKPTQSREHFSGGPDRKYKRSICKASATGDWKLASSYDINHPDWVCSPLTKDGDTALHIAVRMEKTIFVVKLVQRLSEKDMEIRREDGNTVFCIAAISGNMEIVKVLFRKNPGLVWIKGNEEKLPIQLASSAGHFSMVDFLFKRTHEDMQMNLPFHDIVKLFFVALTCNIYAVALSFLSKIPRLACAENEDRLNALQLLAQKPYDNKHDRDYKEFLRLLFERMEEEEEDQHLQHERISRAMFDAAKSGNDTILKLIFNYNPNMFMENNSERQNILHIAILHRQASVYRLILKKGSYKNVLVQCGDIYGNNVLHLAGKLVGEGRLASPIHQTHICNEELWFEEVEKIVPPAFKTMKNKEGWTPKELFYKEHKRSSEKAIAELNGIANNFIVVGTLLLTLGITGALTIRTNDIKGDTRIFKEKTWYVIFIVSVGLGMSLCASSMLLFTSVILPSTWREKGGGGFVNSRLTRMTFGYICIFSSVIVMGIISTISGAMLVYNFLPVWVFCLIGVLCGIPTILYFSLFYYSLHFSCRQIRGFFQKNAAKILSKMGIHYTWDPFYLD